MNVLEVNIIFQLLDCNFKEFMIREGRLFLKNPEDLEQCLKIYYKIILSIENLIKWDIKIDIFNFEQFFQNE